MDIAILRRPTRTGHFKIYPASADSATIEVKHLTTEERLEVYAAAETLQEEGMGKETAYRLAFARAAVLGWEGIFDGGEPLPFTRENRDWLMEHCTEFRACVLAAATTLTRQAEKN